MIDINIGHVPGLGNFSNKDTKYFRGRKSLLCDDNTVSHKLDRCELGREGSGTTKVGTGCE